MVFCSDNNLFSPMCLLSFVTSICLITSKLLQFPFSLQSFIPNCLLISNCYLFHWKQGGLLNKGAWFTHAVKNQGILLAQRKTGMIQLNSGGSSVQNCFEQLEIEGSCVCHYWRKPEGSKGALVCIMGKAYDLKTLHGKNQEEYRLSVFEEKG